MGCVSMSSAICLQRTPPLKVKQIVLVAEHIRPFFVFWFLSFNCKQWSLSICEVLSVVELQTLIV